MKKIMKTVSDLTECPFCGDGILYTKDWVEGPAMTRMNYKLDPEAVDQYDMYAGLMHKQGDRLYCGNCGKFIGNLSDGRLSVAAINQLSKNLNDSE